MDRRLTLGVALYTGQRAPGASGPLYTDAVPLAQAAERAGFDVFWVSEHHGWADAYLPAPLTVAAAIAAATSRITIGTGLAIAPLYHPVRLAEEAAVVDNLSAGRLLLGLGAGYLPPEFEALGADWHRRGRRLEATLTELRRLWRAEGFPVPVPPRGFLPVWLGGYADAAIDRAGRLADGHLVGRAAPGVVERAGARLARFRDPRDPSFTFAANVSVLLEDEDAAPSSARDGYARQQLAYEAVQREHDAYAGRVARDPAAAGLALGSIDAYFQARGDAAAVIDQVVDTMRPAAGWASLHVALRILFPEPDLDAQTARLQVFGERVLPGLRQRLAILEP